VGKAIECAEKALEIAEKCGSSKEEIKASTLLSFALAYTDRLEEALACGKRSCELAEQSGQPQLTGAALVAYASANVAAGHLLKAKRIYERAGEVFRKMGYVYNIAVVNVNLGTVWQSLGRMKEAARDYSCALEQFEEMGATASLGISKCNLASALLDLGEYDRCMALTEEVLSAYDAAKYPAIQGNALIVRGSCLIKKGSPEQGLALVENGWQLRQSEGRLHDRGDVSDARVEAALLSGDTDWALDESADFLKEGDTGKSDIILFRALVCRLRVLVAAGLASHASEIVKSLRNADVSGFSPYVQAVGQAAIVEFLASTGKMTEAEKLLKRLRATGRLNRETVAHTQLSIGEAALEARQLARARKYLSRARKNYSILAEAGHREDELQRIETALRQM
jgi:tetratricopeptide (TPR) repeat protein